MFKAKASKEVKVGERLYQLICENDSPLEELLDVLRIFTRDVQGIYDSAKKKSEEAVEPELGEVK